MFGEKSKREGEKPAFSVGKKGALVTVVLPCRTPILPFMQSAVVARQVVGGLAAPAEVRARIARLNLRGWVVS
jgi:hypothetical protein